MREVATTHNTSTGAPIDWPTSNRTGRRGVWLAENARAGDQDVNFGTKSMGAHMLSSEAVIVPWGLMQDEQYNLIGYINDELVERIGRSSNEAMTTGDGVGKPTGIVNGATLGVTGVSVDGITSDELIDMEHSVNSAYRKGAGWMFSDASLKVVKKLKDGDGRPLWRPGVTGSDPDDILGYGYTINDDMADMATGEKSVLFGDLSRYLIRQVMDVGLYRLTGDEHTRHAQTGFLAWTRLDGKLMDVSGESVKFFQNA